MKKCILIASSLLAATSFAYTPSDFIFCDTAKISHETFDLNQADKKIILESCYHDLIIEQSTCFAGTAEVIANILTQLSWGDNEEVIESAEVITPNRIDFEYKNVVDNYTETKVIKSCARTKHQ